MILHVVLFTPRPELSERDRATLRATLQSALTEIPVIRSHKVGRRVRLGTTYDRVAPLDFEFLVTIEVDDERALSAYLEHPAHQRLGQLFYQTSAVALACDFELREISDLE